MAEEVLRSGERYDENGMPIYKDGIISTFKGLFRHLGKYKKDTFLAWLFVSLETVFEILIPFMMQFLVNSIDVEVGQQINLGYTFLIGLAMVLFACGGVVTGIMAGYWSASASAGLGHNLRQAMFYKTQDFSFDNIDKFSTSSIVTRMTTDVVNVQFAFQMGVRAFLRAPMLMIFAIIMSFITSWQLAFIFVIIVPIIGCGILALSTYVHPLFVKIFRKYDVLNENTEENIAGIRAVKAFGREEQQKARFHETSSFIDKMFTKTEKIMALNNPLMMFASYGSMLLLCFFGAMLITSNVDPETKVGLLSTGALSSLLAYVMQIMLSLMLIMMVYVMIIMSRNSAERIIHVIDEVPDIVSPENPVMEVKDGSVEFKHVFFHYKGNENHDVLKDINLTFKSGETIGIVGPTGSSKTTLLSLLARLYDVTGGSVKIGGVDVRDYDLKVLRDAVAVVLQKNVLFTGTIRENLKWGDLDATDEEMIAAAKLAQAHPFVSSFPAGYDTKLVEGGTNVSGGQKQRLCIARALLKKPKVLILDDSTSAVDTHTDSLIRKALREEIPNTTKFIVSQRVLSVMDCDHILVMDDGEIIAHGTNDELMASSPVYKELYESQLGGGDFDVAE